jgi:hypothetical protein
MQKLVKLYHGDLGAGGVGIGSRFYMWEVLRLANLSKLARKLQTALCLQGRYIKINQYQHYSEKKERMVTKYVLYEKRVIDGKERNVAMLESYQMAEVVKTLAEMLDAGGETGA